MFYTGFPLDLEKSGIGENLEKTWNFEQKSLKNLEFKNIFIFSRKVLI